MAMNCPSRGQNPLELPSHPLGFGASVPRRPRIQTLFVFVIFRENSSLFQEIDEREEREIVKCRKKSLGRRFHWNPTVLILFYFFHNLGGSFGFLL